MTTLLGIDPGLNGAFCFMDIEPSGQSAMLDVKVMPLVCKGELNLNMIQQYLTDKTINYTYLELVGAIHGCGSTQTFKFGRVFGVIEGMLAANKIPFVLVSPKKWQREIHTGCPTKLKAKDKSLLSISRIFPAHDFRKSERSRVQHDGKVDATLIAEYGRRCLNRF